MRTCCRNVWDSCRDWRACWTSASHRPSRTHATCSGLPAWPGNLTGLSVLGYPSRGSRLPNTRHAVLHDAWQSVGRAEEDASAYFTTAALREDVEGLAGRFDSEHHGLGKLSGDYRADKKSLASFTRDGVNKDDAHRHLRLAVAWKQAADALASAETAHAVILGRLLRGQVHGLESASRRT